MLTTSLKILNEHYQTLNNEGQDVIQGLTRTPKSLPPKYFYDDRGSELFEQICELPEYYPTRTEASILRQYADEIAQITGVCELVELGSGSSTKTLFLLDAYERLASYCRYIPIDVSRGIVQSSVLKLQQKYPAFFIEGLIGTYEQALAKLESTFASSRMIFFLGSSLGNFNPQECNIFLRKIAKTLQPGDYFLLGIDLQKPKEILEPAYNDSQGVTAAFNLNMLSHLNWRFQGNFDLHLFTHQAIYNQADAQIEMYLHCQKSHQVSLEALGLEVFFADGESILTEISRKFDLANMQKQLEAHGLKTLKIWTDPKQWFGLILCQA
ncbi:L-histidine N(alpha)-methyltransferase [Desmonostoc muscorum CCALA 125]|uniref:L-histidine N(Alpha)-methyltransferase n=1 Tax=Desmonostoc muscorum LEGE 12446 TaxID=1828758 RepID=A0A8J7ACW9_DESMC|nr:L-histidine N(alpha)-methyltransferase [Desmonostoc muscorum]MBX9259030.1 L-histidine N(alpha)-methyltransferase [Desmonostoc muscorum CCALA 125]MCF2147997.1 L-histidine N(alpha)-methyltransferase [Desmonostoc muscorum LEGE 12446]